MEMKQKTKGAISIFLIIIFLATYVLSGLLVDGGRIKLASTIAESTLDNAVSSALTYYDNYLFDLYGLFAVEEPDINKIKSLLESYITRTLTLTSDNQDETSKLLLELILSSSGVESYFDGYDYNIKELKVGSNINLSQVEVTESQIIEHMKYRAPMELVSEAGGFLEDLESIISIKDRFTALREKNNVTKKYNKAELFKKNSELLARINKFKDEIGSYGSDPLDLKIVSKKAGYKNVWDYVDEFDTKVQEINNKHLDEWEDPEERGKKVALEIEEEIVILVASLNKIVENGVKLHNNAIKLKNDIKELNNEYKEYVEELKIASEKNSHSEHYKTVFYPEIELATSNAGELLKNLDVIMKSTLHTNVSGEKGKITTIEYAARAIVSRMERGNPENDPISLRKELKDKYTQFEGGYLYFDNISEKLDNLFGLYNLYKDTRTQEINVRNVGPHEEDKENIEVKEDKKIKSINIKDIEFAVDTSVTEDDYKDLVYDNMDFDNVDLFLDEGLSFIGKITKALTEDVRDNLYVNEYILGNFRNHVHHHNMQLKPVTTYPDKIMAEHLLKTPYTNTSYTVAEVEYILSGKTNAVMSLINVKSKLLGIRTVLNMAAIFTDSAKISQASVMASFSGPWAPVVSFLILSGWAIAEAACDVYDLTCGKEVDFFKQGGDWQIGLEGAAKRVLKIITEEVEDFIGSVTDQYFEIAEKGINTAIYDFYNNKAPTLEEAKKSIRDLENQFNSQASDLAEFNRKVFGEVEAALDKTLDFTEDLKDQLVGKISEGFATAKDKRDKLVGGSLDKISKAIHTKLVGYFPYGEVVNTGKNLGVKFGYGDYLRLFLLFMPNDLKVARIQQIIQVNMKQKYKDFTMSKAYVNVWAEMEPSVKYLFMSGAIIPDEFKREGRHVFKVYSNISY